MSVKLTEGNVATVLSDVAKTVRRHANAPQDGEILLVWSAYNFNPQTLVNWLPVINELLDQLTDRVRKDGGCPVIYASETKAGTTWTFSRTAYEDLVAMGCAVGRLEIGVIRNSIMTPIREAPDYLERQEALKRLVEGGANYLTDGSHAAEQPTTETTEGTDMPAKQETIKTATAMTKEQAQLELEIQKLSVAREGTRLIVPSTVSYKAAITALERKIDEDERDVKIHEKFEMTVPEGAIAFYRALHELYGFVDGLVTPGFFGDNPPQLIKVQTSPTESVTLPWGRFGVPGVKGFIETQISWKNGVPYFAIAATVAGRCKDEIDRLAKTIRLQHAAIYKGKSIRVAFPSMDEATSMEDFFPQFLTLPNVSKTDLIFTPDVQELVEVGLFTPVEKTQFCRDHGIPLKRGILLEGPYGVGKTLTVNVAAKLCEQAGWTFIQVSRARDLAQAIAFALLHQPAMVFCEDIDEVMQDENDRDEKINAILNQADGVDSKGSEVITVFTTNDLEAITTAMLRPGRIDTVVPVRPPDAMAAQRLIRHYAGSSLSPAEDLTQAGQLLAGNNAAVVREVVTRSKLSAVRRVTESVADLQLNAHDIELAARQMQAHSQLLEEEPDDDRSAYEKGCSMLAEALRSLHAAQPASVSNGQLAAAAVAVQATTDVLQH